jgi:hypothetical protein
MPLGNELVLELARAAISNEKLGADRKADMLVVSLSAHDYVAHGWGHESWEAWDMTLRLDAQLAQFLDALDQLVGRERWAMLVTSDHGGSPLPERSKGGRYNVEKLQEAANNAAAAVLGNGTWIDHVAYPSVWMSRAALAQPTKELKNAMKKIVFALRSFPGLAIVDRTDAYAGRCDERSGDAKTICLAIDPERSGEFTFIPGPGWIIQDEAEPLATAHGSLNDYDRLVPVILLPFGRAAHEAQTTPTGEMSLADVAPTLTSWLGKQ